MEVNRALDKRFFGGPILVREAFRVKAAQVETTYQGAPTLSALDQPSPLCRNDYWVRLLDSASARWRSK